MMNSVYDVQQILKSFGTFIYTGDRIADMELMLNEIKELYNAGILDAEKYKLSVLILRHEMNRLQVEKGEK